MRKFIVCLLLLFGAFCFADSPKRIVSIAPGFTEILYALGLNAEIVGTTTYCDYPPEAKATEKIGDMMNPNLEKIIALRPDMVICGKWKWKVPENLRSVGIQVVEVPDAEKMSDLLNRIAFIGEKVGRKEKAETIIADMKARLENVRKRNAGLPPVRVYVELDSGNWTSGGTSYLDESLQLIGLQNIFSDRKEPYLMVTLESVAARNPDLILSMWRKKDEINSTAAWNAIRAVREDRILDRDDMNWDAILRQGPRFADGIENLEKLVRHK